MAINGDFIQGYGAGKAAAVSEKVAETVTEWLEENVDPDSGYVIDKSLTIEGAAADSKATGDAVDDLKSALMNANPLVCTWGYGQINTETGAAEPNAYMTIRLMHEQFYKLKAGTIIVPNAGFVYKVSFYAEANKQTFIDTFHGETALTSEAYIVQNDVYARFTVGKPENPELDISDGDLAISLVVSRAGQECETLHEILDDMDVTIGNVPSGKTVQGQISDNADAINELNTAVFDGGDYEKATRLRDWEQGRISYSTGTITDSSTTISSDYVYVDANTVLIPLASHKMRLYVYDDSKVYLGALNYTNDWYLTKNTYGTFDAEVTGATILGTSALSGETSAYVRVNILNNDVLTDIVPSEGIYAFEVSQVVDSLSLVEKAEILTTAASVPSLWFFGGWNWNTGYTMESNSILHTMLLPTYITKAEAINGYKLIVGVYDNNVFVGNWNGTRPVAGTNTFFTEVDLTAIYELGYNAALQLRKTDSTSETFEAVKNVLLTINKEKSGGPIVTAAIKRPPRVSFNFDHDILACPAEISEMHDILMDNDQTSNANKGRTMFYKAYELFDALVANYPELITRVDAYAYAGIAKPSYMSAGVNGKTWIVQNVSDTISQAEDDVIEVPAKNLSGNAVGYETYMYIISSNSSAIGNTTRHQKPKILLYSGTHGYEVQGVIDNYFIAKNLLTCPTADWWKLMAQFDFYIIPCLNGFGMHYSSRLNGNLVNITRNYPSSNWAAATSSTLMRDNPGASAGSEQETKLILKLADMLSAPIVIDHHNYDQTRGRAFYTTTCNETLLRSLYNALADISFVYTKYFPEYFGSKYNVFIDAQGYAPGAPSSGATPGAPEYYWEDVGVPCGGIIETSSVFNFLGGQAVAGSSNLAYTPDVIRANEYVMRAQLLRMAEYYLDYVYEA